ncbi:MAG: magnesium transporter [Pseudomonadota bacterium]
MAEPQTVSDEANEERLFASVLDAYSDGLEDETRVQLHRLDEPAIARLLESTPPITRNALWALLDNETENQVLQYLHEDVRLEFLDSMDTEQLVQAADELDTDDFADILQQLPDETSDEVLDSLPTTDRARLEAVLSYSEDCAGGLMNTDMVTVRPRHTLETVLRYLRGRRSLPESTDALIVVNSRDEYVGLLPIARLVTSNASVTVREIMNTDVEAIPVDLPDTEIARRFTDLDLISAAVVSPEGIVVGRITIDDVVDVIIEDAQEAVMGKAGMDADEDTFAPILKSFRSRALWLGINLATAFLASAVINLFEDTIAKVVALAILMPIVASMGGIAGTQTLTLVVRGMALGHVRRSNLLYLLNREVVVGIMNGLLMAVIVAGAAGLVFQDTTLGTVIAVAMVTNILVAAVAGTLLPSVLQALRIDPAIAGGVVLTTVTDVVGFFVFLGLATVMYA